MPVHLSNQFSFVEKPKICFHSKNFQQLRRIAVKRQCPSLPRVPVLLPDGTLPCSLEDSKLAESIHPDPFPLPSCKRLKECTLASFTRTEGCSPADEYLQYISRRQSQMEGGQMRKQNREIPIMKEHDNGRARGRLRMCFLKMQE